MVWKSLRKIEIENLKKSKKFIEERIKRMKNSSPCKEKNKGWPK